MHAFASLPSRGLVSPSPPEVARRVRAAFAYAGLDVTKPVEGLRIDPSTIQRILDPINPRGAKSEFELRQIAQATGVPVGFLLCGFMAEGLHRAEPITANGNGYDARRRPVADLSEDNSELQASLASQSASSARRGETGSPATRPERVAEAAQARAISRQLWRSTRPRPSRWRRGRAWWE